MKKKLIELIKNLLKNKEQDLLLILDFTKTDEEIIDDLVNKGLLKFKVKDEN
ncbi:MAG: hypothetical protein WCO09_00190 [bacterium]